MIIGNACTELPLGLDNDVTGNHKYVFAPLTFKVVVSPLQIVEVIAFTVIIGFGNTVIEIVDVSAHPAILLPTTVYVVLTNGNT